MPKRVGFLYDKMLDRDFIRKTILKASRKRTNRSDYAKILARLDLYVEKTYQLLQSESYVPSAPKQREMYDPSAQKVRLISVVPAWPDGIIHWLIVEAMKPVFMRGMYHWSSASIPKRGTKHVYKHIQKVMQNDIHGTKYALEMDVKHFYPSIPKNKLIWAVARKVKDKRFLKLIYSIIDSCGDGLAIGYYVCQWLANYYLEPLDHFICTLPGVKHMSRHMDNIVILGANKRQLHKAREKIADFMKALGLQMKGDWQVFRTTFTPETEKRHAALDERKKRLQKPRMVTAVGYRYSHTHTILRKRNFLRFTRQCRRVIKRLNAGKPIAYRQAAGLLSRTGFLKHCNSQKIREKYFDPIGMKKLKEVVRNESKRRLSTKQCICYRRNA